MHLSETSLIKKYENDIGTSIVEVGGDINHDNHWLPYLDNQIDRQLISKDAPMEKVKELVDEALDERGVSQEAIDSWNENADESVRYTPQPDRTSTEQRQARENIGLSQEEIDAWNQAVLDLGDLKQRVAFLEDLPATQITQNQINSWDQAVEDLKGEVHFDIPQTLTENQQEQARANIGLEKDDMYKSQWWDNIIEE